jgi:uncharacterized protein (TIGR02594 family)
MSNYTVYVNPYLVLRSGGYTKHYYIESQKIVSKLGSGWDDSGKGPLETSKAGEGKVNYENKQQQLSDAIVKNLKFLGQDGAILTAGKSGKVPPGQLNTKGSSGGGSEPSTSTVESFQYYFHADHLGSTSYITDASGEVYQHLEYFAFGETFVEEHSNTNRTPYLFNGKELDDETRLYYYGARYYDARTSIFIATDPHAENYSGWTPYNYCANNPLNITDPNGMDWYDIDGNIQWKDHTGDLTIGDNTYKSLGSDFIGKHKETGQRIHYAANGQSGALLDEAVVVGEKPQINPNASSSATGVNNDKAPWMDHAYKEFYKGVAEVKGDSHNPRIIEYLKSAGISGSLLKDETPWCASFAHWSMARAGIQGAGAKGTKWSTWGQALEGPVYGSIAVFNTGHVGLVAGKKGDNLIILHGNWSNKISLSNYIKPTEISLYRYPTGYTPSKKFP